MGVEDITEDDVLEDVAAFLADRIGGRPGPDWFTSRELYDKMIAEHPEKRDMTFPTFIYRFNKMVDAGVFEHVESYYKKVGQS